jgi:hypothetical protein
LRKGVLLEFCVILDDGKARLRDCDGGDDKKGNG